MPSQELKRAIDLQQSLLSEFGAGQTPEEFRAIYRCFLGQFPVPPVSVRERGCGGVPAEWMVPSGNPASARSCTCTVGAIW